MSEDPIGLNSNDTNFYRYVMSSPTRLSDASGHGPFAGEACHLLNMANAKSTFDGLTQAREEALMSINDQIFNLNKKQSKTQPCDKAMLEAIDTELYNLNKMKERIDLDYNVRLGALGILTGGLVLACDGVYFLPQLP